jgi:hypothetical protein
MTISPEQTTTEAAVNFDHADPSRLSALTSTTATPGVGNVHAIQLGDP